ncbi:unnamed protein product [Rotaria magnacalcarata]|uniref:UMOD/GP2/OIT3-like D8C domain-containing protein n=1 Tax=Rotaria magnacalcarata TaxID=392030 RepID=A0A816XFT7_9BILA|nr:unnamed protein product [Rotaria magnacalcarata]CAF4191671.1 unnamed protein product [Rotaria magnacalcarata]
MSTADKKSAWNNREGELSGSWNVKECIIMPSGRCLLGLTIGMLLGGVALAAIITLWIQNQQSATTAIVSTASVAATTVGTTTIVALPGQCSNYTSNTDATRNAAYSGVGSSTCDNPTPFGYNPTWVRFSGAAGTQLANTVVNSSLCSTSATGWYSGVMPSSAGTTNNGTVCYNWSGLSCWQSNTISVTNCNGYYVFLLPATPSCSYRYCTT